MSRLTRAYSHSLLLSNALNHTGLQTDKHELDLINCARSSITSKSTFLSLSGRKLFGDGYSGLEYDYRGLINLYDSQGIFFI